MNRFTSRCVALAVVLMSLIVLTDRAAAAAMRAYSARGTGQFVSATEFVGQGNATHLGAYTEAGTLAFTPTSDPAVLHVEGTITYTAANGSELHATVSGQLNGATGAVSATVTYVGGTGRFTHASGSSQLTGQASPTGALSVQVRGAIDY